LAIPGIVSTDITFAFTCIYTPTQHNNKGKKVKMFQHHSKKRVTSTGKKKKSTDHQFKDYHFDSQFSPLNWYVYIYRNITTAMNTVDL
jgi:hypothetical protein